MNGHEEDLFIRVAKEIRRRTGWFKFCFTLNKQKQNVVARELDVPYREINFGDKNAEPIAHFPFLVVAKTDGKLYVDFPFTRTIAERW